MAVNCEHANLKTFTFSPAVGGKTIEQCPDCTYGDAARVKILNPGGQKNRPRSFWKSLDTRFPRRSDWISPCRLTSQARSRNGEATSCGCFQRSELAIRNEGNAHGVTHGATKADASPALKRTYSSWKAAVQRTTNPKANRGRDWHRYGGYGVTVCERWLEITSRADALGRHPLNKPLRIITGGKDHEHRWLQTRM
jgi:hypothetical protein